MQTKQLAYKGNKIIKYHIFGLVVIQEKKNNRLSY